MMFYIMCKDGGEAKKISEELLGKKLIACANYFPAKSIYRWKEGVQHDDEVVLILKTTDEKADEVEEEVKKLHSYDVPCITRIDTSSNKEYEDWVRGEVGS